MLQGELDSTNFQFSYLTELVYEMYDGVRQDNFLIHNKRMNSDLHSSIAYSERLFEFE